MELEIEMKSRFVKTKSITHDFANLSWKSMKWALTIFEIPKSSEM